MAIQNIAVLGAGQMGNGITQVAAAAGYNVTMIDIQQEYVDKGLATIERSLGNEFKRTHVQEDADATLIASHFQPIVLTVQIATLWLKPFLRLLI